MTQHQEELLLAQINGLRLENQALIHHLKITNELLFQAIVFASRLDTDALGSLFIQVKAHITAIESLSPKQ